MQLLAVSKKLQSHRRRDQQWQRIYTESWPKLPSKYAGYLRKHFIYFQYQQKTEFMPNPGSVALEPKAGGCVELLVV